MTREGYPVSLDAVPEQAREYLRIIEEWQSLPMVRECFHQVASLIIIKEDGRQTQFFAIEFHCFNRAALVWLDGSDIWRAGGWRPLVHEDADITCGKPLGAEYFQDSLTAQDFVDVLVLSSSRLLETYGQRSLPPFLSKTNSSEGTGIAYEKPWWKFW